ncbi:MAG: hypothetical protein A2096_07100 [Spirochaetes bacterium GWF1_41_5]|nr:MAG: hypothetical protein A2096_07100 [Spirochaetes bacterium GWF1_41_5]HBE02862.1 hypothetical protein [Spirochaetia bacterium]
MPSFTSNSKSGFLLITVTAALFCFLVYSLLVNAKVIKPAHGQSDRQKNIIKAERYLYSPKYFPAVIVGSSLSARMEDEFFPGWLYNLSFHGGSPYTGMEFIKKKPKLPRLLLVEINIIEGEVDRSLLNIFSPPLLPAWRQFLPVLRDQYKPSGVLTDAVIGLRAKTVKEKRAQGRDEKIFSENLNLFYRLNMQEPEYEKIANRISQLEEYCGHFSAQGVKIIFFEMPVDIKIRQARRPAWVREKIIEKFGAENLLQPSSDRSYITTDSLHLVYKSAEEFAAVISAYAGAQGIPPGAGDK